MVRLEETLVVGPSDCIIVLAVLLVAVGWRFGLWRGESCLGP